MIIWSWRWDSNPRPQPRQGSSLDPNRSSIDAPRPFKILGRRLKRLFAVRAVATSRTYAWGATSVGWGGTRQTKAGWGPALLAAPTAGCVKYAENEQEPSYRRPASCRQNSYDSELHRASTHLHQIGGSSSRIISVLEEVLPSPVLSVGLTGHRKVPIDGITAEAIENGIGAVLEALQRATRWPIATTAAASGTISKRRRLGHSRPTNSVSMTWRATSGSGRRIAIIRTTTVRLPTVRPGPAAIAVSVSPAAVPGACLPTSSAPGPASDSPPRFGATIGAFGSPGRFLLLEPLRFYLLGPGAKCFGPLVRRQTPPICFGACQKVHETSRQIWCGA